MKLKYLSMTIVLVCTWLAAGEGLVIRVKAVGRSSSAITLKEKARAAAFRAAKAEGYKKLAEAAGLAKINQSGTNKQIRVDTILKGVRVVGKRYLSDYEVEVVMEMPLPASPAQAGPTGKPTPLRLEIANLKKEISVLESQMQAFSKRLAELKEAVAALEEKVNHRGHQEEEAPGS